MMRVRRMLIAPEVLMFMGSGSFRVIQQALPDDAELRQTTVDPQGGWISLFIESQQFEEVRPGDIVPVLVAPLISRVED